MSLFGRFRRSRSQPPSFIDPPGYRLSTPPAPPPPAGSVVDASVAAAPTAPGKPSMRLMMADGTVQEMPADPEMEARAEYLIRSMLPPAPPPPPASS